MLIAVGDAHLLDVLSAPVVHQAAQARRTRLVITVRTWRGSPMRSPAL